MRRLVRTRYGQMLVNDRDIYLGRSLVEYGEFSRGEQDLFERVIRLGQVVSDVGANIGVHTLWFAHLVGRQGAVFAFEPQRLLFQMLCANVALNRYDHVYAYQHAIGAAESHVCIASLNPDVEQSFGSASLDKLERETGEPVPVFRLMGHAHFVKVDVEGMEAAVLRGAADMIRACRPLLYVENDRADRSAELLALIRDLGYVPRWHVTPLFNPENWAGNPNDVWDAAYMSFNLACAPAGAEPEAFAALDEARGSHLDWIEEHDCAEVAA